MSRIGEQAQPASSRMHRLLSATFACALLLAGCSTTESQSYVVAKGSQVESAQIAVGADFSKYDRLQAADMGIFFPAGTSMREDDLQRLRKAFRDAFTVELEGYSVSRDPGPTTMLVEASLIDLRGSSGNAAMSLRRDIRDLAKSGSLVFLMEMKDSETGQILARAADSARTPALATSDTTETDWEAVESAAAHWALLFRQFLDEYLGKHP